MLYDFLCTSCNTQHEEVFAMSDYDNRVNSRGLLKNAKCENCGKNTLYRNIIQAPGALGGQKGYVSMERWAQQNKDVEKSNAEKLEKFVRDRKKRRVHDKLDGKNKK